jgi:hypothetical protein
LKIGRVIVSRVDAQTMAYVFPKGNNKNPIDNRLFCGHGSGVTMEIFMQAETKPKFHVHEIQYQDGHYEYHVKAGRKIISRYDFYRQAQIALNALMLDALMQKLGQDQSA